MGQKHGGNLKYYAKVANLPESEILDFSANINPLGPPDWLRSEINANLWNVVNYPDPECQELLENASEYYGCPKDEIIAGNGSTELLFALPRILLQKRAIIPVPTYLDYATAMQAANLNTELFPLQEDDDFIPDLDKLESLLQGNEIITLCNPNNPTGYLLDTDYIRNMATRNPSTIFLVDEAFGGLVSDFSSIVKNRPSNVIVLSSLTKIFAMPGLRIGCLVADSPFIAKLRSILPTWSVNYLSQLVTAKCLKDRTYINKSRATVSNNRLILESLLKEIPDLKCYKGSANFLLCKLLNNTFNSVKLADELLKAGIAIRVCSNFNGLDESYFRLAVRTEQENHRLVHELKRALGHRNLPTLRKKKPAIMFQGTSSNAGKSILTAAMGRILLQDGYKVAPFKSQNMSLNSFVTLDGKEMGRAQVVQAQACKLDPDVRMNPILLKPNSDTGSQVIVMGTPVGNMNVHEYIDYKPSAFSAAKQAFDSLQSEFDVIVLEGAGSPAEINLKHHDIVNMHMARYADCPVLLVGDIDRGGVFASFVGTMDVLSEWERALVAGFIINKFRGNPDLLGDAISYCQKFTGKPTYGIIPYLHKLGVPEEDSVSFKSGLIKQEDPEQDFVTISVIDLPHISNFTDFDALRLEPDVKLNIVKSPADMNGCDAIIIPGTKNTIGDLDYLNQSGIAGIIKQAVAKNNVQLIGICGGFQMIGSKISDPYMLESQGKPIRGLEFLNMETMLEKEKKLVRYEGTHLLSGQKVFGYEIHHGRSFGEIEPVVANTEGEHDGGRTQDHKVWGTYIHGIFDADGFRRWFIDRLRLQKGLPEKNKIMATYDIESALDTLADTVRANMDIKTLYSIMGL